MIPATVLLGSMAAGGLGLYLSGSTGPPKAIEKPVEQSIANEVSRPIQYVPPQQEPEALPEIPQKAPEPVPVAEVPQKVPEPEAVPEPVPEPVAELPQKTPEPVPAAEPEVAKPVPEVPESPEEEPTAVQGGQRGGFGRPTWAPVNAGTSLTQALGIVPGTPAGNALATATGSKTPQQIQLELVAIDEQIRALNASTFSLTQEEKEADDALATSRKELQDLEDEIFRNQKLVTFLTGKINSTSNIQETNVKLTKLVVDEVTPIFNGPPDNLQLGGKKKGKPGKPGGTGVFTPTDKQKEWLVKAFRYYRNLPDDERDEDILDLFRIDGRTELTREASGSTRIPNYTSDDTLKSSDAFDLTKVATDDAEKASALRWWNFLRGKVHQEEIDPTKVQAELIGYMNQKRGFDDTLRLSEYKIPDAKEKTKENETELQEIRTKLSENKKKKKELESSRELLLTELSAYKVPQSFFDKKEVKPSVLPTGEVLNKLLIEFRQIEDDIARNEREKNDYVSIQLASNPSWTGDARYEELNKAKEELKKKKSNKIAEIEGRAPSQLEQLKENPFEVFARELIKDKLTKQAGEVLLKTSFPQVFKMYFELSKSSADTIYDKVDKYYNFFKKGVSSSINLTSFNGQDVSRALAFFFALTKEQGLSPELKEKVTQFSQENKQIIANALVNLELALQQIKTPTTEERSIVEQALMSGESVPWKTIKRAAVSLDVSNLFTKTVEQKLIILKDSFRERIYDKLKDVSVKYGLWGKTEIQGYRQTIEASFDEYKKLLLAEIATFNAIPDNDPKQNQSITKIRGLARLMMTLLQQGDMLRQFLESILDSPEFKGGAKLTPDEFKNSLKEIKVRLEKSNDTRLFVLDGKQALFDQLVQAKAMIFKKNINLKNLVDRYRKLGPYETIQNISEKLAAAKELLQAYDDLEKVFESLDKKQTTGKQKELIVEDLETYKETREQLRAKIEQTETEINSGKYVAKKGRELAKLDRKIREANAKASIPLESLEERIKRIAAERKAPPPEDKTWEPIVKLSEKAASVLGSILSLLPSIPNLGIISALQSISTFFSRSLSAKTPPVLTQPLTTKKIEDAGTDADKKEICVQNVGEQFLWNGITYAVTSIQTKNFEECLETFTANSPTASDRTEYNVKLNDQGKIESFEAIKPKQEDGGTDADKKTICLHNIGDQFLWNGTLYAVTSIQTRDFEECLKTFTANKPSASDRTEYNVKLNDQGIIESFEAIKPKQEDLTKPVLTGVPTDTTITLSWDAKPDVTYTLEQDFVDVGAVTTPEIITDLTPNTSYSFKIIAKKDGQTVDSNDISVKTLETTAAATAAAADIIQGKFFGTSARDIIWTNDVLKILFPAKPDAELTPLVTKLNTLNANTDLADDVLVYPSSTTFGQIRWTTLVNGNKTKLVRLATEETIPARGSEAERFLRKTIADALAAPGPTGPGPIPFPDMPTLKVADLLPVNYKFKTYTHNNTNNLIPDDEKRKLAPLYTEARWGAWVPSSEAEATYYIGYTSPEKYITVTSNLSSQPRKQRYILDYLPQFHGGVAGIYDSGTIKNETSGTVVTNALRGSNVFSDLYYFYFNKLKDNTWRYTLDEGNLVKYKSVGWDLLYSNTGVTGDIGVAFKPTINYLPYKSPRNEYLMVHLEPKKIVIPAAFVETHGFKQVPCSSQNDNGHPKLCGVYVIANSLFITYLSKFAPSKIGVLADATIVSYYVKYITYVIIKYFQYLIVNDPSEIDQKLFLYYSDARGTLLTLDKIKEASDTFVAAVPYIGEAGAVEQFSENFHWNIPIKKFEETNILLNLDWMQTNVMMVQNSFDTRRDYDVPIYCRNVLFSSENIKKLKNFYSFENYTLTFIIGNNGHWKCYTVNKIGNEKQYLFLNSIPGGPAQDISQKIIQLTSKSSFEDYIIEVLNCFTPATADATYASYEGYLNNMLSALLRERIFKTKIPNYDVFVKTLITRIIHEDLTFFNSETTYAANRLRSPADQQCQAFIMRIDEVITSGLPANDPIKQHYYSELAKYIGGPGKIYEEYCRTRLSGETKAALDLLVSAPVKPSIDPRLFAAPGTALIIGNYVKLKPVTSKEYPKTSCLLYGMNEPASRRVRFGKIEKIVGDEAEVRCYNKVAGKLQNGTKSNYKLVDLEKTTLETEGIPPGTKVGGYTRRQRVRGMPSRLKTRRTY